MTASGTTRHRCSTLALVFAAMLQDVRPQSAPIADVQPSGSSGSDGGSFDVAVSVSHLVGEPASGSFVVRFHPEWAPLGAARVRELVGAGFFDECRFFRVIDHFMAQFGINGTPRMMREWSGKSIPDDPRRTGVGNTRGRITFAMAGPGSRSTQLFVNFGDNSYLDAMGFTPVGEVTSGMDVVDRIYLAGESAPQGPGPVPGQIHAKGNDYLAKDFPRLTIIDSARIPPAVQRGAQDVVGATSKQHAVAQEAADARPDAVDGPGDEADHTAAGSADTSSNAEDDLSISLPMAMAAVLAVGSLALVAIKAKRCCARPNDGEAPKQV